MFRIFVLLLLLVLPYSVSASSVVRSGESVSVGVNQAVEGDFYVLGNSVVISGEVTEDVLAMAAALKVNGQVGKDIFVVAGKVDVDGVVGEDLRLVAGEAVIAGEVKGDLVVVAGKLSVLSTAKVSGDILFFGTEANISGQVGKSVFGTSEKINIDGVVFGDIDVKTSSLSLSDQADITGTVKYVSSGELLRAQNAKVGGKIVKNDPTTIDKQNVKTAIIPLLVLLFATLVWYLLFPKLLHKVAIQSVEHSTRSFLIGTGILIVTPFIVGVLIVSTLGMLLGTATMFLYLGVIIMSIPVGAAVVGVYLSSTFKKDKTITLPKVLLGAVLLFLLPFVPVLGPIIFLAIMLVTLGALSTHLYRSIKFS